MSTRHAIVVRVSHFAHCCTVLPPSTLFQLQIFGAELVSDCNSIELRALRQYGARRRQYMKAQRHSSQRRRGSHHLRDLRTFLKRCFSRVDFDCYNWVFDSDLRSRWLFYLGRERSRVHSSTVRREVKPWTQTPVVPDMGRLLFLPTSSLMYVGPN